MVPVYALTRSNHIINRLREVWGAPPDRMTILPIGIFYVKGEVFYEYTPDNRRVLPTFVTGKDGGRGTSGGAGTNGETSTSLI